MNTELLDKLAELLNDSAYPETKEAIGQAHVALERVLWLAHELQEKRSDISDCLYGILEGKAPDSHDIEHRYIQAEIPIGAGDLITVEYDTLTTLMYWNAYGDSEWNECLNHTYKDDDDEEDESAG